MDPLSLPNHRCPHCDHLLREWQVHDVLVEGCDECGGVWFDREELQRAAKVAGDPLEALEGEFTRGLGGDAGGGKYLCPKDQTALVPKKIKHLPDIEVDFCPACGGVWLDDGELAMLATKVPKVEGPIPAPPPGSTSHRINAVASALRVVECPACGEPNPELSRRCADCGADLRAPRPAVEQPISVHTFRWWLVLGELALLGALVVLILYPEKILDLGHRYHYRPRDYAAPGTAQILTVVAIGLVYLLRWPFRLMRAEVSRDGLYLQRWIGRKFVPWDSFRGAAVFDLGLRSIFASRYSENAFGFRRSRYDGDVLWDYDSSSFFEYFRGPKAIMFAATSRGLVIVGPSMSNHFLLLDQIRDRMNT